MRIRIRHETAYRYTEPIEYAAQLIRLTPSDHATQRTLRWRVYEVGRDNLPASDDGYGNIIFIIDNRAIIAEPSVPLCWMTETVFESGHHFIFDFLVQEMVDMLLHFDDVIWVD